MVASGAFFVTLGAVLLPDSVSSSASGFFSAVVSQGTIVFFGLVLFATALLYREERTRNP